MYMEVSDYIQAFGEMRDLLRVWATVDSDPCYHDHHGYCQARFMQLGDDCIVKKTRELLETYNDA